MSMSQVLMTDHMLPGLVPAILLAYRPRSLMSFRASAFLRTSWYAPTENVYCAVDATVELSFPSAACSIFRAWRRKASASFVLPLARNRLDILLNPTARFTRPGPGCCSQDDDRLA